MIYVFLNYFISFYLLIQDHFADSMVSITSFKSQLEERRHLKLSERYKKRKPISEQYHFIKKMFHEIEFLLLSFLLKLRRCY